MITEKAYAKINLALEITEKRTDGFHNLNSIMIPLELHDILTFKLSDDVTITGNIDIPNNNMFETVQVIKKAYQINQGVEINYIKNIPMGAGLGGGSANIAAVIRGLNKLWNMALTMEKMEDLANQLGSDTLHCLHNKPSHIFGRGDKIEFIPAPKKSDVYLICNRDIVLTRDVFANHEQLKKKSAFPEILHLYETDFETFKSVTSNDLLYATLSISSSFAKTFYTIKKMTPNVFMTGSGPTLFLLNKPTKEIEKHLNDYEKNLFMVKTQFKL